MNNPKRLTPQMQQEEISRHQLCECLIKFGWLAVSPKDLGEDFIIHIYNEGIASGVPFHVQQKSVTDLPNRKAGDFVEYRLEVKDLLHWEGFHVPIVLIVWDINLREGRWASVRELISELDSRRPNWRHNKTKATVKIPWNQGTDDKGLIILRQYIGGELLPVIFKDRSLEINVALQFSDTEEGRQAKEAYLKFWRRGQEATFVGRVIQKFEVSEWAKPWLGWYDPDKIMLIIGKDLSEAIFPAELSFCTDEGKTISLPRTTLKAVTVGDE